MLSFSYPLRPFARFRCDAGFLDPAYFDKHGKHHRGIDLNLITGGDTDLGYPVSSMFPGVVTHSAVVGSWGGIVVVRADEWVRQVVEARLGRTIEVLDVQYAHLIHLPLDVGEVVNAGDVLGAVGKGTHGQYFAHLHLQVMSRESNPAQAQGGTSEDRERAELECLDPQIVMQKVYVSDHPTTLAQRAYYAPTRVLSVEHAGEAAVLIHPVGDKVYLEGI